MSIKQLEADIKAAKEQVVKAETKLAALLCAPDAKYPVSKMSAAEMSRAYHRIPFADERERCAELANAVLRHACDNGQVVTRAEFDRAIGDRAARDLAIAKAISRKVMESFVSADRMPVSVAELMQVISEVK